MHSCGVARVILILNLAFLIFLNVYKSSEGSGVQLGSSPPRLLVNAICTKIAKYAPVIKL